MNWLNSMEWLEGLLRASWQAGLLVLVVLALRAVFKEKLAPKWRHVLWFLVVARLALPLTVESPWSAFNLLSSSAKPVAVAPTRFAPSLKISEQASVVPENRPEGVSIPDEALFAPVAARTEISPRSIAPVASAPASFRWAHWFMRIWLAGIAVLGLRLALAVVLFTRRMKHATPVEDAAALALLSECARMAGVRRVPQLLECDAVTTPAICGHWRPRLLMPPRLLASFTSDELRHVFFHELAHVKRRDVAVNWLTSFLQIIHWFNPLVWFAFARMRTDREVACDALAIQLAGDGQSRSYGDTILKLLETMARPSLTPALVGILEDKDQLRVRITMIARFGRASRWSWLIAPLLFVLAFVTLTDAQTTDAKKKLPPVLPLTITNILAEAENKDWLNDAVWQVAPRGTQDFGGIRFHLEGVVQLKGQGFGPTKPYREKVVVPVPTNSAWGAVHVIGGTAYDAEPGTRVADLVWNYTDGSSRKVPILYAVHVRDWWRLKYEKPDRVKDPLSKVIWNARHIDASKQGKTLRLYRMTLANPLPEKKAKSIEFVSANVRPSLIFNALTLDPLKAGERPDDSFDIEELDIEPKGHLKVTVLDAATSNAVADAAIKISVREQTGTLLQGSYDREFKTGPAGIVEIPVPEEGIDRLQLQASATNYTSRLIAWVKTNNEAIPVSHTFYLKGSFAIGGTIVDEEGNPVGGARISVLRTYSTPEDSPNNQKGERDEFSTREVTSGSAGTWVASGLAYGLRANLMIGVRHPEFLYQTVWFRDAESDLRAKTHRLMLARGESISGRVIGPDDQPVGGAKIRAVTRSSADTNEVTADNDGRFRLSRISTNSYERTVSVSAKGFAPLQQSLPSAESKEELVLKLKVGTKLKIQLRTPEAEPVSGARCIVNLPGRAGGIGRWEVQGLSSEDGRFDFEAEDGVNYSLTVLSRDWEAIRDRTIKASADEQIITMRARRKLVGQAVDAESGEPLSKGAVTFGIYDGSPRLIGTIRSAQPFENAEGRFEVAFTENREDAIKVSAEDHEAVTIRLTEADFAAQPFVVRLKRSPSLKGVVRTKEGRVIPGAIVAFGGGANFVSIAGGAVAPEANSDGVVRTDSQGRFSLQMVPGANIVLASGDGLFGNASVDEVKSSGEIILGGSGKITGSITLNGKPIAGRRLQVALPDGSASARITTDSDEAGKFLFPEVPSGKWSVVEMIPGFRTGSFTFGEKAAVEVKAGETVEATIAKVGLKVVGRLVPPPSAAARYASVILRSGPDVGFVPVSPGPPVAQQYQEWQASDAGKRASAAMRRSVSAAVQPNGVFTFESLSPGEYKMQTMVMDAAGTSTANPTVVIPEAVPGQDEFDLGSIELRSQSKPAPKP